MKKAYKKSYNFLSGQRAEQYSLFLKKNLLSLNPKYYVVVGQKRIITSDGEMFALRISTAVESYGLEPIAECWINGSDIYLWQDRCWGIAIDKDGNEIKNLQITGLETTIKALRLKPIDKTVLLFPIGTDKVE
jgi:hypothetical protein